MIDSQKYTGRDRTTDVASVCVYIILKINISVGRVFY